MSTIFDDDIRSGPDRYISEPGVAKRLPEYLREYRNPLIITGRKSESAFLRYTKFSDFPAPVLHYDGSATLQNAHDLAREADGADAIVAIGAGKLSDTVKNVAEEIGCHLIIIPTLAATCSAYSALSVNYDGEHRYVESHLHEHNSDLVLVDTGLISTGPIEYLVGGIGDTLAKWYESDPVFARANALRAFDRLSQRSAALIRDILLEHSESALHSVHAGQTSESLRLVIDTIIGLGGTVGGFGGTRARASGAHAIHDALTLLPGSSHTVHGAKVAYGIIIQLLAQDDAAEALTLLPFYRSIGLPHTFAAMHLEPTHKALATVATFAASPQAAFGLAVPEITPEQIVKAMEQAETL